MEVEVIRSARRRKTIEARMVGSTLEVRVPARLSRREEEQCVADMVERFAHRRDRGGIDLEKRAATLARRHDLPVPDGVRWVDNQRRRWGSCTVATGQIRISSVLAGYPTWVLDYVLVHEMAHLVEANHGPAFHDLVARYPKAERAEGFLIAKGLGDELDDGELDDGELDDGELDDGEPDDGEPDDGEPDDRVPPGDAASVGTTPGRRRRPSAPPLLAGVIEQPSLF